MARLIHSSTSRAGAEHYTAQHPMGCPKCQKVYRYIFMPDQKRHQLLVDCDWTHEAAFTIDPTQQGNGKTDQRTLSLDEGLAEAEAAIAKHEAECKGPKRKSVKTNDEEVEE